MKWVMSPALLPAALLLAAATTVGIIALTTNHWTVGSSSGDQSYVGLWKACFQNAGGGGSLPDFCTNVNKQTGTALLSALGDTDASSHWSLFNAARICMIVGTALMGVAAIVCCLWFCLLWTRWLLILPFVLSVAAVVLMALAPIFWGVLQDRSLSKFPGWPTKLGYSWILAVIGVGLGLLALLFELCATCGPSVRKARRKDRQRAAGGLDTTSAAVGAGAVAGGVAAAPYQGTTQYAPAGAVEMTRAGVAAPAAVGVATMAYPSLDDPSMHVPVKAAPIAPVTGQGQAAAPASQQIGGAYGPYEVVPLQSQGAAAPAVPMQLSNSTTTIPSTTLPAYQP